MPGSKNQRSALYYYAREYGNRENCSVKDAIEACYLQYDCFKSLSIEAFDSHGFSLQDGKP
jgi:hypothetical protein